MDNAGRACGKCQSCTYFFMPAHTPAGHVVYMELTLSESGANIVHTCTCWLQARRGRSAELFTDDTANKVAETTGARMKQGHAVHCSSKVRYCGAGP